MRKRFQLFAVFAFADQDEPRVRQLGKRLNHQTLSFAGDERAGGRHADEDGA